MATLVKCEYCGVLTYSLRVGDDCDRCNQGTMKADSAEPDFRGHVDAPAESDFRPGQAGQGTGDWSGVEAGRRDSADVAGQDPNASAFGRDQPDNPIIDDVPAVEMAPRKGPKVTGHDGADLWDLLRDGAFHKAKDLAMENRKIRAVCAVYPNQFLSTQAGYKVVKLATVCEIENAIADLRSRMSHLNRRASALESVLRDRSQPGFDV